MQQNRAALHSGETGRLAVRVAGGAVLLQAGRWRAPGSGWAAPGRGCAGRPVPDRRSRVPNPLSPECTDLGQVLKGAAPADPHSSPSPNSSMTTGELQEYWRKEKRCWRRVKLLFEVAAARIEERTMSKFVVSGRRSSGSERLPYTASFPAARASAGPRLSQL